MPVVAFDREWGQTYNRVNIVIGNNCMKQLTLQPIKQVEGQVRLPGSKSLSNRILLLSALAQGSTEVYNLLASDDTRYMLAALERLGVNLSLSEDQTRCQVEGLGGPFPAQETELFLGNAGTAVRPLCAALCLGQGVFTLTGEPRMNQRPIGDLVEALVPLGANIEYLNEAGYLPLRIHASGLNGGEVSIRGNISSQYLTALLLTSPLAQSELLIRVDGDLVSKPYIAMTLDVMKRFGVDVENSNYNWFRVGSGQGYRSPGRALVEGDASSATYFLAAAAIGGGPVRVMGVGSDSVQGDVQLANVLEQMGAIVQQRTGLDRGAPG